MDKHTPTVLTIAGYDPYGGAGVLIDTKTIHALGGYALGAITAITAQNSQGVRSVEAVSPQLLHQQLSTLLDDIQVDAVKIGMLAHAQIIDVVVDIIQKYRPKNIVLDTVLSSSSGRSLLADDAVEKLVCDLFPHADLITPNLIEANRILQAHCAASSTQEIETILHQLQLLGVQNILLKGGHIAQSQATDYLLSHKRIIHYSAPWIDTTHTHGTGCVLSSAIATHLAIGLGLAKSVKNAKEFLHQKLENSDTLRLQYVSLTAPKREPIHTLSDFSLK
jgi:hydroxymethylpyrimidine/phosphomethylpyrimidine kinase